MNKTPDEIKKGLECLDKMQFFMGQRAGRELWMDIESYNCCIKIERNLIQQLEKERHQLLTRCERLERERDALMKEVRGKCWACKIRVPFREGSSAGTCPFFCLENAPGKCPHWKWRGVKEE